MIWTEESAALLARAYQYGEAAGTLADWISPKLKENVHICDVGCGVGTLSLELARRGHRVTALDICEVPLKQLIKSEDEALRRIDVLCADAKTHTPYTPYDAMVFCFFGSMEECLRISARCCKGDVIYISRDYDMHRFSVNNHPVHYGGYRQARAMLEQIGVPYEAKECALDMGQPFADMDEARRFFALYSRDDPALITDEFLLSRLVMSSDGDYPLYLPHMRKTGMLHFHVKDIPPMGAEQR